MRLIRRTVLLSQTGLAALMISLSVGIFATENGFAKINESEITQKTAENQIRRLLEPLLDKYCHDSCKLMAVNVSLELAVPDETAPGFDEIENRKNNQLTPSSARAKILIDDKVGPVSRNKLLDLLQQYLDNLDYPVKIDTQIAHFPAPLGSESRISELRDRISKQFLATTQELLTQFCPQNCILADFNLQTETVNGEEAQYGASGEFFQDGDTAVRIKQISATLMMDETLTKEEQLNILEMAKLKTNGFKHVNFEPKVFKFPHPSPIEPGRRNGPRGLASDSDSVNTSEKIEKGSVINNETKNSEKNSSLSTENKNSTESSSSNNLKQEKLERFEKIERVENGDAVQAELQKFKIFGLLFAASVIGLLIFIAMASYRPAGQIASKTHVVHSQAPSFSEESKPSPKPSNLSSSVDPSAEDRSFSLSTRYEIERLTSELLSIYSEQPKVAKQVFSRVLTEEGIESTAACIHIFGEAIVIDMLRDPSLQVELTELMEFYIKNPFDLSDDEKLGLLKKLHNRTLVGKLAVIGNRSSRLFDFLGEMDGMQILELIRTESITVKSIVLTQCDPQKRTVVYSQIEPEYRMELLTELSRIDYLPKNYIFNVANALKRKKQENPKLNTEALPGSEVLVSLLERTGQSMQKTIIKSLETTNPESARTVKSKLVSLDTLRFLRDGQLLEVVLSLKHEELIQFLKGVHDEIRQTIFAKAPRDLVVELEEELAQAQAISRETYLALERKILNRIKIMSSDGLINLIETNERMLTSEEIQAAFIETEPSAPGQNPALKNQNAEIKKVARW